MFCYKYYIVTFSLLLLVSQTACGQIQNAPNSEKDEIVQKVDSRIENLKKQADDLVDAVNKGDFDRFIELTHPQVIKKVGGRENLISIMKKVFDQNPKIFESFSASAGIPNMLVESEELLFGVVPQKIEGITHKKHKVISNDCVVGVSNDDGKTWKFVSGEKFDEIFPLSKSKIQIVARKTFVDGIEQ